ncbi:ketosynthase chain-length factor [Streptomyces lacrimifluminis]|uniref:Actinorhodin polyketide putative beta-ketoacyl synthase 2 n=1 Tax=Streptomyces lacrimifluminis TaxID=1500077 RepID=A0A917NNY7_9ACTN|nr:beta-ketoacyl synthase N-terminal-like domain-containing protein [Streptomyces lacrimifluminis]GGJ14838.1 actinorhodin polyketide putative beta-ketoacyl synthase 2 [Streptomyces lacrimifluminis]
MTAPTTAPGTPGTSSSTAVITGIGVAAPNGLGTEAWWAATLRGENGIRRVEAYDASAYPSSLAGLIIGFDAAGHLPGRLLPQTDRCTRLALTAADWALADSGADPAALPEYATGVVTSSATGGFEFTHREARKLWTRGPQHVSVYESFAWFYAANSGQISIRHGIRGASGVFVAEQAGGLDAIGHARRTLRKGSSLVVTGGVESALDPWGFVSHIAGGRVSRRTEADRAYLPFDKDASGHVPGEGGAMLVLEDMSAAVRRQAPRVYGELAGYAATFDPPPGSGRPPGLERAARLALADAGLAPGDVDAVFADAAAVPALDDAEAAAVEALFGPYGVPVSVPKTLTGRLMGGAGPLDVVAALLSIRDGVLPPVAHVDRPVPHHRLDLVRGEPRPARVRHALVLARGHGGFNAAAVVSGAPDLPSAAADPSATFPPVPDP